MLLYHHNCVFCQVLLFVGNELFTENRWLCWNMGITYTNNCYPAWVGEPLLVCSDMARIQGRPKILSADF